MSAAPAPPAGLMDLLARLRQQGVELHLEGDKLRLRAPKGALTDELRAALATRRDEIVEFLRRAQGGDVPPRSRPIRRTPRGGDLPLSFAQERLWFLDRLQPGTAAYNMFESLWARGELSPPLLAAVLAEIVRRHEGLRTTFEEREGAPAQVIAPPSRPELPLVDLSALPEERRRPVARRLIREEALRPFDLARGPLLRARLLRLEADEHALLLNVHHIVSDGWSQGVLVREISALYGAGHAGAPSPLPELPVQYADFAVWQREWLTGAELERQLAYWRRQLAGTLPVVELPFDHPRPAAAEAYRGAQYAAFLDAGVTGELARLARGHEATLFMVLLAAFQTLLLRLTGGEDLPVGSPVANRNREEIEPLIGFFVNTLVLRGDLAGDPPFRELLARVRRTTLEAYDHQDLPFERLVEALRPERRMSTNPLFQTLCALQNAPAESIELTGLSLSQTPPEVSSTRLDLELLAWERGGALTTVLSYSPDLFDASTIQRFSGYLTALLRGLLADPERPVSQAPLLTAGELQQLVREWNDTGREIAGPPLAHGIVARQAALTPGAVAAEHGEERLSYRELAARARRLAAVLRGAGVGPDVPVGLWVGRSLALPVGVLAVLEAGGACLPLDPSYPAERLALMIGDAGPRVVLAEEGELAGVPAGLLDGLEVVVLDERGETAAAPLPSAPGPGPDPGHLAYILYTSGSTGRPKGVALPHRALVNMAAWASAARPERARVLQFSPLSFDVSFEEMFSTWGTGGTLVMMPEEMRRDPNALLAFLFEKGIERLFQPFVALQQLAEAAREQGRTPPALRELVTAGEQLRITPAVAALCAGGARLFNEYGPTETHLTSAFVLRGDPGGWPALPPIGRPIANHRILLLDRGRRPVPAGAAGELCIGGAGLARGYFRRPGLTAERFIPDPGGTEPGARLYRTGDLARWTAGGDLEYLGRTDFQVKVRGYRVEPGEVEAAVAAHPGVRDAAVVARQDPGGLRLVAYVVWEEAGDEAVLRAALKAALPAPMVPTAFVGLAALPLTPSGKVDRRALAGPAFAPQGAAAAAGYVEPAAGAERELAAIWSEVLGVERVGAGDDFFDLGGHSLLATRVVSRVRRALGIELPLRVIFEAPTVAALAAWIERSREAAGSSPIMPPVVRVPRGGGLPLSFAQTRLWFLDRLAPGSATYTLPFALRLSGGLSPAVLAAVLGEVVRRHEALRTTFAERGGEPVQVIAPAGPWVLPLLDLGGLPAAAREAEARRLAESAAARPFDLERGPLFRAGLLRLGAAEHILLLDIHHIVADGWSLGVLVQEITALYGAALAGTGSPLPELPVQYADFAAWQRSWLQGEELRRRLAYWRQRLAGSPAILELPADRPRPAVPARPVGRVTTVLDPDLSRRLARFAQGNGASLFMLLLAGFQALLGRLTGQRDLPIGSPVANRNQPEIEPLIGFFVNLLVLRGDLAGDPSFRELLARVRQATLEDYAHQDLPFELLVEELRPQRHLSATPLFQVMFALQNAPTGKMDLPGLSFAPLEVEPSFTRFDLELNAWESEGALSLSFIYSAELFDRATVQRLAGSLEALLRSAAAGSGRRLSELPLLTEAARHQLAVEWNDTRPAPAPDEAMPESVLARFAARVAAAPDAVALEAGEERLTYAELDRRANRLAHRLRRLGVGAGGTVGLFAERSAAMVAGILGIWKAGGAYLPLDPAHPLARLAYLLEDSEVPVIAAGAGLADLLPPSPARIASLDDPLEEESDLPPGGMPGPGDLAYRIYTSGTTGGPKAVLVEHGSLAGTLAAVQEAFGFRAGDRMPCIASFSFDIFLFELLGPLLAGGTCVLLPLRPTLDLERLLGELDTATHLHAVPALMRQVLELARRRGTPAPRLRGVFTGGDAVPADLLADLRDAFPRAAVRELYGPTETTIVCSFWPVPAEGAVRSLLGRPFAGVEIHVRDGAGDPSPIGAPGEIWIGGGGVAQGYWRREELTAEKFVVSGGRRFFRSGDRARRLPDGTLEFLGRADQQVKVRGFRIEPGEVEAALLRLPGVAAAVVEAREVVAGAGPQLVAYVVPAAPPELRRALEAELPDYMVPSWFVPLAALPLTVHGKVDRRALPDPDPAAGRKSEYLPPATAIEESLAAACAEVLGLERVGMSDNFFALGGHSLLAVQLTSRLRDRYALEVPLQMVFEATDLLDLANRLVGQVMAEVGDLSLEELQALLSAEETAP